MSGQSQKKIQSDRLTKSLMAAKAAVEGGTAAVRRTSWRRPKSNLEANLKGPTSGPLRTK